MSTAPTTDTRTRLAVEASKLWVTTAEGTTIWKAEGDLGWIVREGFARAEGVERGACGTEDHEVVVLLNVDGEPDFHEVYTDHAFGVSHVEVIEQAIKALQAARDGIRRAEAAS